MYKKKKKYQDIRKVEYWKRKRGIRIIAKKYLVEGYGHPYNMHEYWYPIQAVIFLEVIFEKGCKIVHVDEWENVWDERKGDPILGYGSIYEFIEEQYEFKEKRAIGTAGIGAGLGQVDRDSIYLKPRDRRAYVH